MISDMFSPEQIQNEVHTINSEHPYYEDHFERKSRSIFLHLIKVLKERRIIDIAQGKIKHGIKHVIIITHSKCGAYYLF